MVEVINLSKTFTLHEQGGVRIEAFRDVNLKVFPGECLALNGPSGSGKSSLLRSIYANYVPQEGRILVRRLGETVDLAAAPPRRVLEIRRTTVGFVSQFLRVIPRVASIDIVAAPLIRRGSSPESARLAAEEILDRLNIPRRLWPLPPATFSGGEQQRINAARGFVSPYPILLLDEPTASLDVRNRDTVVGLIESAKKRGAAVIGIFHDSDVRGLVADRVYEMRK